MFVTTELTRRLVASIGAIAIATVSLAAAVGPALAGLAA